MRETERQRERDRETVCVRGEKRETERECVRERREIERNL